MLHTGCYLSTSLRTLFDVTCFSSHSRHLREEYGTKRTQEEDRANRRLGASTISSVPLDRREVQGKRPRRPQPFMARQREISCTSCHT